MSNILDNLVSGSVNLATTAGNQALSDLLAANANSHGVVPPQTTSTPAPVAPGGFNKWLIIGGIVVLAVVGFFFFRKK